ncbi:DUF1573 domain-containing protein [Roseiconus nitratireducens]|uniref:DUF1573 domain-containing protein n=1 Tax=Roseiconus nitratireducens TaxID=2605748 RepID=A0A5M6D324_9BACT|nr:DUF1573 domain-containing protein [Roseiconus nitratireducens]KAA5540980.1 DUF1573 domain-containing protein [Roseiconus nitratireducens]
MNPFTRRLLVFGLFILGFASIALALSQTVNYKPWGVPDNRREEYEQKVAELDRAAAVREAIAGQPKAIASVANPFRDFGWVDTGQTYSHAFEIRNDGDAELTLQLGETSCECLDAELESTTLSPGQETRCLVRYTARPDDAERREGLYEPQTATVTVLSNDPQRPRLNLQTRGQLTSSLVLPDGFDFGSTDLGKPAEVQFLVYSQQWESFELLDIRSDQLRIQWSADPVDLTLDELNGKQATSAQRVTLSAEAKDYGAFTGQLTFEIAAKSAGQPPARHLVDFSGRVRPPVGFYGPNIDSRYGLDIGTLESGKQHDFFVTVRSRADHQRKLAVLDVEPGVLQAALEPLQTEGVYRLRVTVPPDCPDTQFNLDQKRGFVQVGDPDFPSYSNWLPLYGVVAGAAKQSNRPQ